MKTYQESEIEEKFEVAGESTKTRIETFYPQESASFLVPGVARESKKTRIETSNLLEKGLIQKKTGSDIIPAYKNADTFCEAKIKFFW